MRRLGAVELIELWSDAADQSPPRRALALLAAVGDGAELDPVVGLGNAQLLLLREALFGPTLTASLACPGCGEAIEAHLRADALTSGRKPSPDAVPMPGHHPGLAVRPLRWTDLLAVADADDGGAREELLRRAIEPGADRPAAPLTAVTAARIVEALVELDPDLVVSLTIACPSCGGTHEVPLDVAAFVWAEIDGWCRRALQDVHELASAYGWTETAILALPAARRRTYLELLGR